MKLLLGTLRGGSARRATLLSGSRRGVSICTVDAFALQGPRPFSGNPAAVCVLPQQQGQGQPPPDEDWMQSVALEMNLSETAFLERRGEARYGLRWFTPTDEVDLCGHATLASSHAIWANAHSPPTATLTFETRSGELHATPTEGGWIELDFPSEAGRGEIVPGTEEHASVAECIGLAPSELSFVGRNRMDILVEVARPSFEQLSPDYGLMTRSVPDCRVLSVTALSSSSSHDDPPEADFVTRSFAPWVGVDEDPVCGSAHCFLGPHWAGRLGKSTLVSACLSPRGGTVRVRLEGERVVLGGQAVLTMQGELTPTACKACSSSSAA